MSRYRLYRELEMTEYLAKGTSPKKALQELAAAAGLELASQNGRYGRTTTGENLAAMTEPWSRAHYADARTTRTQR